MEAVSMDQVVQLVQVGVAIILALVFTLTVAWGVSNYFKAREWKLLARALHKSYSEMTQSTVEYILARRDTPAQQVRAFEELTEIDRQIQQALDLANDNKKGN